MKASLLTLGALALSSASAAPALFERGATQWMGTSLYFLQGLSDSDQNTYIDALSNYGIKVVRIWANSQAGGNACEKGSQIATAVPAYETSIGSYNSATLDALDYVMNKLVANGIKVIISPHDGNSLLGNGDYREDIYYQTYGSSGFYTSSGARQAYKNRLNAMVNYKGKYSGQVWKNWTEAILAFDIQNEPYVGDLSICQDDDPAGWMCDVALSFRESLGGENPIKITTGGAGGDDSHGCTTMSAATNCGQIDVIAAHKYGGPESSNADQWTNSVNNWYSKVNGKLLFIEEWGANQALASAVTDWPAQADDIINSGVPNVYWQLVPAENSACPYNPATDSGDEYSIFVNGNVNVGSIVAKANAASAKQDWSAIVPGT